MIISGPSGSGKTTLCSRMMESFGPQMQRVITATTRPPRAGESSGVDYFFLTPTEFEQRIQAGEFYEWAQVHAHRYGTLKDEIQGKLKKNIDLLLNLDVQGAAAFRVAAETDVLLAKSLITVFIIPESFDQLRHRLRRRGDDDEAEIERRLITAEKELNHGKHFDHRIISGTRNEDFEQLCRIYETEKRRTTRDREPSE